jgi:hypothetical protein
VAIVRVVRTRLDLDDEDVAGRRHTEQVDSAGGERRFAADHHHRPVEPEVVDGDQVGRLPKDLLQFELAVRVALHEFHRALTPDQDPPRHGPSRRSMPP